MKSATMAFIAVVILTIGVYGPRNKASPTKVTDSFTAVIRHVSPDIGTIDKVPKHSVQIEPAIYFNDVATISNEKLTTANSTADTAIYNNLSMGAIAHGFSKRHNGLLMTYPPTWAAGGALNATDHVVGIDQTTAAKRAA